MSIALCYSTSILLTFAIADVSSTSTLAYTPSSIFPFGANVIASFICCSITPTFTSPFS